MSVRKELFMSNEIHTQKHMTLSDRIFIEQSLADHCSFKDIASVLKKDPSTISKEIRKHRTLKKGSHFGMKNNCALLSSCQSARICDGKLCNGPCKRSKVCDCTKHCAAFTPSVCPALKKPPYVCNGCPNRACRHDKYYYRAKDADSSYEQLKHDCRQGVNLTPEERASLDALVSPLILSGQTMVHIFAEHGEAIPCSERTLYRYIDSGILSVRNIDLHRKVKYKPRRQSDDSERLSREYIVGRTYTDFLEFLEDHPETNVVELDTVVGPEPGKVLLTMLFRNCTFMLAFLMVDTKSNSVVQVFRFLQRELDPDTFARLFPVILTDRGSEFSNPLALERDEYGEILSKVFYCNPNAPYQKGRLEKNHGFLRYIIPKGTSFDAMTQEDITLAINHINSTARGSLNGRTPFELASLLLDEKLLRLLHLEPVEPDSVLLKPALLKQH